MSRVWVCSDCYNGPTLYVGTLEPQKCVLCGEKKAMDATYPKWIEGDNCPRCRVPLTVSVQEDFQKWRGCGKCGYKRRELPPNEEKKDG